jgi:hypothetical protein
MQAQWGGHGRAAGAGELLLVHVFGGMMTKPCCGDNARDHGDVAE